MLFRKLANNSDQQGKKYKQGYDKSVKGPQLHENDLVLVKMLPIKADISSRIGGNQKSML